MHPALGLVIVVQVLEHVGKNNNYELPDGRIGKLYRGDIFPAVLGPRRAPPRYSGDVPASLTPGDTLTHLCRSGIVGQLCGRNPEFHAPLPVKVLGSALLNGQPVHLSDNARCSTCALPDSAPIVAVAGTGSESGKTAVASALIRTFTREGRKVAAVKLTGVGSVQDLDALRDAGAGPVRGFNDHGLVATCIDDTELVIRAALSAIEAVNEHKPDLIVAEFGGALMDEHHVTDLLRCEELRRHVRALIVAAGDLTGAWGAKALLKSVGVEPTVFTGPVANNESCVRFMEENFGVTAESNRGEMSKTQKVVKERLG